MNTSQTFKFQAMFYAFYDNQTGRYMSSGLNCTSKEEAVGQMASYLSIDTDEKTIREMLDKTVPIEDRIAMVEAHDFTFEKSEEKFSEND